MIPRSSLSLLLCLFLLLFSGCQEKRARDSGTPANITKSNDSAVTEPVSFDTSSDSLINETIDLTNSNVSMSQEADPHSPKGFIYSDRGLYCPGDSIFLTFASYDPFRRLPEQSPVSLDLYDPQKKLVKSFRVQHGLNGFFCFKIATLPSFQEGTWIASVKTGDFTFQKNLSFKTTPFINRMNTSERSDSIMEEMGIKPDTNIFTADSGLKLNPVIESPQVLLPEKKVQIKIREKDKKSMTYTLALVDEKLLYPARFLTPDPWKQLCDTVLGNDSNIIRRALQAGLFPPLVKFLGPFELQKNKINIHELDIPRYSGTIRLILTAANQGVFGRAEKTITVTKPVITNSILPGILSTGEKYFLPVSILSSDPGIRKVSVDVTADKPVLLRGSSTKHAYFRKTGIEIIPFELEAAEAGIASIAIKTSAVKDRSEEKHKIKIRKLELITETVDTTLLPENTLEISMPLPGRTKTNRAELEVSRVPYLKISRRLDQLVNLKPGSLEQHLSTAFPLLKISNLLHLSPESIAENKKHIITTIEKLSAFQTSTGGFGFWAEDTSEDEWFSSFAGHFLAEARTIGYKLPQNLFERWKEYQKKMSRSWVAGQQRPELIQSYRLFTLALSGNPDLVSMDRIRGLKDLGTTETWCIAAAYHLAGLPEIATELARNASLTISQYSEQTFTYGSDLRDKALILESLLILHQLEKSWNLVREISIELGDGKKQLTPQAIAWAISSLARHAGVSSGTAEMSFIYSCNGKPEKSSSTPKPVLRIPLEISDESLLTLKLENSGQTPIYPRLILEGTPWVRNEDYESNGLLLQADYEDLAGNTLNIERLIQGQNLEAVISVKNTGSSDYHRIVLNQPVCSGWEIHKTQPDPDDSNRYEFRKIDDNHVYTCFDLKKDEKKAFRVLLKASYIGEFYLPAISVEAMHNPQIRGRIPGKWIRVEKPE